MKPFHFQSEKATPITDDDLETASPGQLLVYALALDVQEGPGVGVLRTAREDLAVLAHLCEHGNAPDTGILAPMLEGIGRRIAVGLEVLRRTASEVGADEAAPDPAS